MSNQPPNDVSQEQAEEAVRTLLRWAGDDPAREGLLDTPKRVVKAYRDWFSGYESDPGDYLRRTFSEVDGYDEMVVLRDIQFESHCEHHMVPIIGARARGLFARSPRGRHLQASAARRCVCEAAADSRKNDRADRRHAERDLAAQGRRRDPRSRASMHHDARHP